MVRTCDADKCLWHIDEEAGHDYGYDGHCGSVFRQHPENHEADGGTYEADEACLVRLALEELVGSPSCQQCSDDTAGDFRCGHYDGGCLDAEASVLCEEGGTPVQNRESDDVNAEVGHCQDPDNRVVEDHFLNELLVSHVRECFIFLDCFFYRSVFVHCLRVGKTY